MAKKHGLIAILVAVAGLLLGGCGLALQPVEDTPTPYPCPEATPEAFYVEPVTSPTSELTQQITVSLGLGESITVESEAGSQTVTADFPTVIEVELVPNSENHLTITGKVREVQQGDCTYGGYVLTTTTDRYGDPLIIEQTTAD